VTFRQYCSYSYPLLISHHLQSLWLTVNKVLIVSQMPQPTCFPAKSTVTREPRAWPRVQPTAGLASGHGVWPDTACVKVKATSKTRVFVSTFDYCFTFALKICSFKIKSVYRLSTQYKMSLRYTRLRLIMTSHNIFKVELLLTGQNKRNRCCPAWSNHLY